jgi:hypothetical protein
VTHRSIKRKEEIPKKILEVFTLSFLFKVLSPHSSLTPFSS